MSQSSSITKTLVEELLPLNKINETARVEAGFIRAPKISNLHPYLARRPTAPARALTLASILPRNVLREEFERALGLDKIGSAPYKLLYLVNPDRTYVKDLVKKYTGRNPEEIVVVDPMAGGGSIPLEALRLGFRTIAIDYNPVAYLILKATLEYPAKYGVKLYEDVKKEVNALIEYAKKDLSQYYAEDAYNYIIARGYRCPNCKGLVPIIHSNKLDDNTYIKFNFDKQNKTFTIEISRSEQPFKRLRCPYCDAPISEDIALKDWVKRHKELLEVAISGDLNKAKEKLQELIETHILLVKETPQGFKPIINADIQAFIKAYLDLTTQINELRDYLPDAQIPKENEVFEPIRTIGIQHWYELFNPRQLLILLKLMKYVKERTEFLIKERGEYGAAIALYLALGINKLMDFNNITTYWAYSVRAIRPLKEHYSGTRTIKLNLEYCEAKRIDEALKWVFEPHVKSIGGTAGGLLPVLKLLSKHLEGLGDRIHVICGDSRYLSSMLKSLSINTVDVVNVDPPYLSQHFYSDLMEFFWQSLRIMLRPAVDNNYIFNRDPTRGKIELYISGWSPYLSSLPREGEIIARRHKDKIIELNKDPSIIEKTPYTGEWYMLKMWEFFREINEILNDEGILIVWFTHSDPRVWETIIASLYAAGFSLIKAWSIWTEMVPGRGIRPVKLSEAFFTSLALVLKKRYVIKSTITSFRTIGELIQHEAVNQNIRQNVLESIVSALNSGASEPEIFVMGLAGGIAGATKIWNPDIDEITKEELPRQKQLFEYINSEKLMINKIKFRKAVNYFDQVLYPVAIYVGSESLLEEYLTRAGLNERMRRDVLNTDAYTKAYLILWTATRYLSEREIVYDFVEKICKIINVQLDELVIHGLVARPSKTSKAKQYRLLFGDECYKALGGRHERLIKTNVGHAIHLLRLIGEQPKDDISKVIKNVLSAMPVGRNTIATALFLLRTASDEELGLIKLSKTVKGFVENVLIKLYQGV